MLAAACSRLCSRVSAWAGAFARNAMSSALVIVFCRVPSASFLYQLETVFFDFMVIVRNFGG